MSAPVFLICSVCRAPLADCACACSAAPGSTRRRGEEPLDDALALAREQLAGLLQLPDYPGDVKSPERLAELWMCGVQSRAAEHDLTVTFALFEHAIREGERFAAALRALAERKECALCANVYGAAAGTAGTCPLCGCTDEEAEQALQNASGGPIEKKPSEPEPESPT